MSWIDDIGDAAQDAAEAGQEAAESGGDGGGDSGSSDESGGTFVDTIEQQEQGDDVTVGGGDYETPTDQPDAPSSGSSSSDSSGSSGGGGSDSIDTGSYTVRQGSDGNIIVEDSVPDAPTGDVGDVELEDPADTQSTGRETRTDMAGTEFSDPDAGQDSGPVESAGEWANEQRDTVRDTVGGAVGSVADRAGNVRDSAGGTVDNTADRVSSGVDSATDTAGDVRDQAGDAVDDAADAGRDAVDRGVSGVQSGVDSAQDAADDAVRDATGGAVGVSDDWTNMEDSGGVGNVVDAGQDVADDVVRDATGGKVGVSPDFTSTGDFYDNAEFNRELGVDLSRGGFLSEDANDNTGLLPGEIGGVDISEDRLRGAAEWGDKQKAEFDKGGDIFGSSKAESALQGAAGMGVDLLNAPQHVLTLEGGAEMAQNTPGAIAEHGAGSYAQTGMIFGRDMGQSMVDEAKADPIAFGSGAAFGYATGAAFGRAAGKTGRMVRDRGRTAGGTKVDPGELTDPEVTRHFDPDGGDGKRFPDADDPDTYQSDPAKAVSEQADEYTPNSVDEFFDNQGVGEGTTIKKGVPTEPDGPGTGRSGDGFTSAPDDLKGNDYAYETPGAFFGPELSPNFLRIDGGESSFSLRPGLPDMGNKPTGVLARTDVENPDSDTLLDFNQEMMDRTGETTAYTKPADEVNVDEIEAIVPPGGEFAPVSGGGMVSNIARRAGVGSDFYTEVGGRRVPLRTVAPADRTPDADVDADAGSTGLFGERGGGSSGESLDYYVESPEPATDRPLPMAPPAGQSTAASEPEPSDTETGRAPAEGDYYDPFDSGYDSRSPTSPEPEPTSTRPESGRDSGRGSPTDGGSGVGLFGEPTSSPPPSGGDEPTSPGGSPTPSDRGGSSPPGSSSPPSSGPPGGSPPGSGGPPSDRGESGPPGSDPPGIGSPFGGGGVDYPTEPTTPQRSRPLRFGGVEDQDDRRRWDEEPVEAETPEYVNPIATGTGMLFDEGGEVAQEGVGADGFEAQAAETFFGAGLDDGAAESGQNDNADGGEGWGGGLFY